MITPELLHLNGRVALVTGASRRIGIGTAICRALAALGADIFFTHWQPYDQTMPWGADQDGPDSLAHEIHSFGVRCAHLKVDLSQPNAYLSVLNTAQEALGMVSILINNATHSVNGDYQALDMDAIDAHYAVNIRSAMMLSVEMARRYTGTSGRIINLSSGQGLGGMPEELAYAATKGAVEAFTVSLAKGVMSCGITVNAVDPGATDTGWMDDALKTHLTATSPTGRIGQPQDAARLIAFLATDAAAWITGQIIHSRGGL